MNKQTLIRLTANSLDSIGKQGIFEGVFNDGILIGKNSQIALQSCSLSRDQDSFTINSINNKISFQVSTSGGLHEIYLNNGDYDSTTIFRVLEDIQDKMNDQLSVSKSKEHNSLIDVRVSDQNQVVIDFRVGVSQPIILDPDTNDPTFTGLHYSKNGGTNEILFAGAGTANAHLTGTLNYSPLTGTRQYIYSPNIFSQGAGLIMTRLDRFEANPDGSEKSGVVVGLLKPTATIMNKLQSENANQKILPEDYEYAICTNTDGNPASPYMIKHPGTNGVFVAITTRPHRHETANPALNDIISIRLSEGHIEIATARSGTVPLLIVIQHSEKYVRRDSNDNTIDYIPYIGIFGSSNQTRIGNSTFGYSPDNTNGYQLNNTTVVGDTPYPKASQRPSIYNVIFHSIDLARFLGFTSLNQNPSNLIMPYITFNASNQITKIFSTNTYLIEMLSEQLDSYDSFDNGRKNILAPIPLSDHVVSNTGIIHYEPNSLMYINLKNDKEKLIRNLRCRVITNSYNPINIEGIADICVLIRS